MIPLINISFLLYDRAVRAGSAPLLWSSKRSTVPFILLPVFGTIAGINSHNTALDQLEAAAAAKKLSASAVKNIPDWLERPYLSDYAPLVAEHLAEEKWEELEDAFWTTIPFGAGGRNLKIRNTSAI